MRGLLPSVWLCGATLYAASILSLTKPFAGDENWPAPPPRNETVMAKDPLAVAANQDAAGDGLLRLAALTAVLTPVRKTEPRNEWVQVGAYTTVVHFGPSPGSPILSAYDAGRPLRVIAREGGFVRVQDLGSGKLGWIAERSLVPFDGNYRPREDLIQAPQLVASAPASELQTEPQAIAANPVALAAPPKKVAAQRGTSRQKKEAIAAAEPEIRGFFRRKRGQVERVALGARDSNFGGFFGRAFRRF
jgi:hypothetical protein